jgi:hypothetical protein
MLVKNTNMGEFIGIFSNDEQKDNTVGISLSRTYKDAQVSKRGGPRYQSSDEYLQNATSITLDNK